MYGHLQRHVGPMGPDQAQVRFRAVSKAIHAKSAVTLEMMTKHQLYTNTTPPT